MRKQIPRCLNFGLNGTIYKSLLFALFLSCATVLTGQETTNDNAKDLAVQFITSRTQTKNLSADLSEVYQSPDTVKNKLSCFQNEPAGFVLVLEYGEELIVAGYSLNGVFDLENIDPGLKKLLQMYEQTTSIDTQTLLDVTGKGDTKSVTPMLEIENINWNQGQYYNDSCPYDADAGNNTLVGCVAVSMGQIMRYHKYPQSGKGSHSYTHPLYGLLEADFENTIYDWDNMPAELTSSNTPVATLLYHCGVGAEMNFGVTESAAYVAKARNAFNSFFRYPDAQYFTSFNYNTNYFYEVLRDELLNGRPFLYELFGDPGHSVVCDGYDGEMFHLNFGWSGSNNGYYLLEGSLGSYIMKGNAIIGISPTRIWTNKQDSLALVALYNSTNGDQWLGNSGWLEGDVYTWQGVTVINGRVIKLELSANKLTGTIPPEIGDLTSLKWMNLSNNALSGNLPPEIGGLTALISLQISSAGLTGSLPSELNNLTELENLNLSGNQLTGEIPTSLYSLTKLTTLNLSVNLLSGNISPLAGQLINLKYFSVFQNQLTGPLPDQIGDMVSLTEFIVSKNQLSGTIPATISGWTNLTNFSIFDNLFEGTLTDAILSFTKLTGLNISNNKFTVLPENIGTLSLLQTIEANDNLITSLPASVAQLSSLYRLNLYNNLLTTLPDLGEMPALWDMQISDNQIEKLPESFGSFTKLSNLSAGNNKLTELPSSFENLTKLKMLALSGNQLKSVPVSFCFLSSLEELYLMDNELSGPMPPLNFLGLYYVDISRNKMTFSDIASSLMPDDTIYTDSYAFNYYDQAKVSLNDTLFTFAEGDSAGVDIRSVSRLSHPDNVYEWYVDDELVQEGAVLNFPEFTSEHEGWYYCRIRNTTYSKVLVLETDSLYLSIKKDDLLDGATIVSSRSSATSEFSDNLVILLPSADLRGEIIWQASTDSLIWTDVSEDMEETSVKESIIAIEENKITLEPKKDLLFRYLLKLEDCDPVISDTIRINSYGDLLVDTLLNVTDKNITISADSIEITIPANFTDEDFRLTIKKLNHPPAAPGESYMASVYDVNVSIGSVFDIPLLIKLKNIDLSTFTPENIDRYKAVYFDEETREWTGFDNAGFSLKDSSLVFETKHLTKLSWLWDTEVISGYTDVFMRNNIRVYYKENDEDRFNLLYGKNQTTQPWHLVTGDTDYGTPVMIQDVAWFLYEVMEAFRSLNLPVPDHAFSVYVKEMDDYGSVGLMGLLNHYLNINRDIDDPLVLRSLMAHEFMHYIQDDFISSNAGNIFWMEAHAHLSDRLVWNESIIPVSESEHYLIDSRTGDNNIFEFLSRSWDYWDKGILTQNTLGNVNYCYLAGTFLHYMRSYKEGVTLKPDILLKETPYLQSWLNYLDSYIQQYMASNIGDQYEEFIKYIVEGSNANFGLLNKTESEDPLKYLKTASADFMTNKFYKFKNTAGKQILKDSLRLTMPYLSTKMVQMYNLNIGKQKVLVKYKRLSLINENSKVYLCRYDSDGKQIGFEDISAIDSSFFIIDSPAGINLAEKKHIAYLLIINKDKTQEFNVDYDFDILPIPEFSFLDAFIFATGLSYSNAAIHTFTDGTTEFIDEFHLMPGVYREYADVYYSPLTINVQVTDETITTQAYSDWFEQSITYNFISGDMTFYDKENWGGLSATDKIDMREITMVLKNVWLLPAPDGSGANFTFSTTNTANTQDVVQSISYTRKLAPYNWVENKHDPLVTSTYLRTNYNDTEGDPIENITFHINFY